MPIKLTGNHPHFFTPFHDCMSVLPNQTLKLSYVSENEDIRKALH
jgi:hypothetical protein